MKKLMKMVAMVMAITICFHCNYVWAQGTGGNIGLAKEPPEIETISTWGMGAPLKSEVYPLNAQSYVEGTSGGFQLYTDKCFYGAKTITINIVNDSNKELKVSLYKYVGDVQIFVKSVKIGAGTTGAHSFSNLNTGTYYFLRFDGTGLDFHGFVGGKTS